LAISWLLIDISLADIGIITPWWLILFYSDMIIDYSHIITMITFSRYIQLISRLLRCHYTLSLRYVTYTLDTTSLPMLLLHNITIFILHTLAIIIHCQPDYCLRHIIDIIYAAIVTPSISLLSATQAVLRLIIIGCIDIIIILIIIDAIIILLH